MRKISFSVTPNGSIEPSLLEIGHEGEHNATTLIATLPKELLLEATYYRLAIGSYQTDKLYAENNTLSYTVPQCVLICGTQFLQLEGYKNSAEGEMLLVFKSDIAMVNVLPSIDPYNQVTDEVKCEVDSALGKLHYYVTQSDELASELKSTTDECASILEEAKQTVYGKADKADTLSGYGITDAYTKSQTDNLLSGKADKLEEWRTVYEEASHSGTLDKEVEYDGYTYPNRYCYSVTSKFSPNKKYRISSSCCFNSSTRNRVEIHIGDVKYTPEYKQIIDHENVLVVGWYTEFTFTGDTEKTHAKIYFYDTDSMPWTECPYIDIKIEEYDYAFAYTKNETDQLLSSKVDKTDVWTKDEAYPSVYVDELVEALEMHKADKSTTLEGYGITDSYTKEECDFRYTSREYVDSGFEEVDSKLKNKADKNKILDYITYQIVNGSVTITDCDTSISGTHIIPEIIEGYPVTVIGNSAFSKCSGLVSITIPNSVIDIGDSAFNGCTALESLVIPDGITIIKADSIPGKYLKKLYLPDSILTIEEGIFPDVGEEHSIEVYYNGTRDQWLKVQMTGFANEGYGSYVTLHCKYDDVPFKPKRLSFADGDTITLANNTTYYANSEISSLTVIYPKTNFICSLEFTLATEGDVTITLPQSRYIGGAPTFANGEAWEINIKNGVVVGGLVE